MAQRVDQRTMRRLDSAMERACTKYADYLDTAYAVSLRLLGEPKEAESLLAEGLGEALQAEENGERVIWAKSHLLTHVRRAYINRYRPELASKHRRWKNRGSSR